MSKLDEQLHKILSHYIGNYVTADEYESDVKEAGQAIQALIAQQVKEARIKELEKLKELELWTNPDGSDGHYDVSEVYITKRIATLKGDDK